MKQPAISRADLLDALVSSERGSTMAFSLLGYERSVVADTRTRLPPNPEGVEEEETDDQFRQPDPESRREYPKPERNQRALAFLVPVEQEVLHPVPLAPEERVPPLTDEEISMPAARQHELVPLAPWSRLAPFLRHRMGRTLASHRLDLRELSRLVASGLPWERLPRLIRPSWGAVMVVLWDISPEMEQFEADVAGVVRRLKRERGRQGLKVIQRHGPPSGVCLETGVPVLIFSALGQLQSEKEVRAGWLKWGNMIKAAGHPLTALVPAKPDRWVPAVAACIPSVAWDRWQRLPRRIAASGPRFASRCDVSAPPHEAVERLTLLLDLLAPASYITPHLLRRVRLLLGPSADASMEHDAKFHPDTEGQESGRYFGFREGPAYVARLDRHRARALAPATAELVRRAKAIIVEEHLRHASSLVVVAAECRTLMETRDTPENLKDEMLLLRRAVERLRELARMPGSSAGYRSGLPAWFCRFVEHGLSPSLRAAPPIAELVAQGLALARAFFADTANPWPGGVDVPAALAELRRLRQPQRRLPTPYWVGEGEGGLWICAERGDRNRLAAIQIDAYGALAQVSNGDGPTTPWMSVPLDQPAVVPLARSESVLIETDCERLRLQPMVRPSWATRWFRDREGVVAEATLGGRVHPIRWVGLDGPLTESQPGVRRFGWVPESRPSWASRLWVDEFGLAAEFSVGGVPFVLRWIPPGRFLMGSPEDENGRDDDEGPQHEVTISRGFWMGETPVTQAQWRAVVEATNAKRKAKERLKPAPSHFKGPPELPVEQVSWDDCRKFCDRFNQLLREGPGFGLPTEAQWEYACRAGTTTALYTGPLTIRGERDGPELDLIAWYGGNSGQDLEVTNPYHSSHWPEKQYNHQKAGTHRVKLKQPNVWGLYDTLGNVWEWCVDAKVPYSVEARVDPRAKEEKGANRVVRGGSWDYLARDCRAAFRGVRLPGFDWYDLGFRLAAGQEFQAAEPVLGAERPRAGEAEPGLRDEARTGVPRSGRF